MDPADFAAAAKDAGSKAYDEAFDAARASGANFADAARAAKVAHNRAYKASDEASWADFHRRLRARTDPPQELR